MSPRRTPEKPASRIDLGKVPTAAWIAAASIVVLAVAGTTILLGSDSSEPRSSSPPSVQSRVEQFAGSALPNVDAANTRRSDDGSISAANVADLDIAWSLPLTGAEGENGHASSPVIADGIIYSQDLGSNVQAIDLESGKVLWETTFDSPSAGPNGVTVAEERVFGTTTKAVFALDQTDGERIWSVPLTRNASERIAMAPGYHDGLVYVSTAPAGEKGGAGGILWALDAKTGKREWSFETVPEGLWGKPEVNFGGGLSYPPAFDGEGFMYAGIGSPGPLAGTERYPWGSSRPGPNLYTASLVKLDAKTGELQWHHQVAPHVICDWALQAPPILLESGRRDLVVAMGRVGFVVALDRDSGELVWKRSVGIHNGHDDDGLYAMRREYSKLKLPMTVYPGPLGGVAAPASTDGSRVFVPVVNASTTLVRQSGARLSESIKGELVALDATSGAVEWRQEFDAAAAYGATTVVDDVVFATTYDGVVRAFDVRTGKRRWEATLPAGTSSGVTVDDGTLIAPAGVTAEGGTAEIVAYRLRGAG